MLTYIQTINIILIPNSNKQRKHNQQNLTLPKEIKIWKNIDP